MMWRFKEVDKMWEKNVDQNKEQRLLPVVIFVMTFFLVSGFVIKKMDLEYISLVEIWADFNEWLHWKLRLGW